YRAVGAAAGRRLEPTEVVSIDVQRQGLDGFVTHVKYHAQDVRTSSDDVGQAQEFVGGWVKFVPTFVFLGVRVVTRRNHPLESQPEARHGADAKFGVPLVGKLVGGL